MPFFLPPRFPLSFSPGTPGLTTLQASFNSTPGQDYCNLLDPRGLRAACSKSDHKLYIILFDESICAVCVHQDLKFLQTPPSSSFLRVVKLLVKMSRFHNFPQIVFLQAVKSPQVPSNRPCTSFPCIMSPSLAGSNNWCFLYARIPPCVFAVYSSFHSTSRS